MQENTTFRETGCFRVSVLWWGEGDINFVGSKWWTVALSKEPNRVSISLPLLHLRTERDPVSETSCFLLFRIPDDGQSNRMCLLLQMSVFKQTQSLLWSPQLPLLVPSYEVSRVHFQIVHLTLNQKIETYGPCLGWTSKLCLNYES
jgi:hypothetical protein